MKIVELLGAIFAYFCIGTVLAIGALVICGTLGISLYLRAQIKQMPAHKSMLDIAEVIFQTCKTYLIQQGKFLMMLFAIIGCAMAFYFLQLKQEPPTTLMLVLLFSLVGMGGSYAVAWYGIRINTYANARTAFASLRGVPAAILDSARPRASKRRP